MSSDVSIAAGGRGEHVSTRPVVWHRVGAVARRLGAMLLALALVLVASFLLVRLIPGDPAVRIAGIHADKAELEEINQQLGLNDPLPQQFGDYVSGLAQGDLGTSFTQHRPVATIISDRLPRTLELAGAAFVLTMLVSIPLGLIIGALTRDDRHRRLDFTFTAGTSLIHAVPDYLMGVLLVFLFGVTWGLLPVAGAEGIEALILPAAATSLGAIAVLARLTRVETRKMLTQDFVRTARAKRLSRSRIYFVHVLPNVLTSALTLGGIVLTGLIGGVVIIENVFAWPGLGTATVQAIEQRDYPLIQGSILLLGIAVVVVNSLVDLTVALLDPRSTIRED